MLSLLASPSAADHWANFRAFKRKFGGIERVYVPGVDVVVDQEAYEAYRNG